MRRSVSEEAKTAVFGIAENLLSGHGSFIVLKIDTSSETVCLETAEQGAFSDFFEVLSVEHAKEPRYSIYCGGQGGAAFVFSCPESAPVRTKMLYSTAKSAVLQAAEVQTCRAIHLRVLLFRTFPREGPDLATSMCIHVCLGVTGPIDAQCSHVWRQHAMPFALVVADSIS